MTLTEFLLTLRETVDEFWTDSYGDIRNGDCCPITEVYGLRS